jgi:hypothetical protein
MKVFTFWKGWLTHLAALCLTEYCTLWLLYFLLQCLKKYLHQFPSCTEWPVQDNNGDQNPLLVESLPLVVWWKELWITSNNAAALTDFFGFFFLSLSLFHSIAVQYLIHDERVHAFQNTLETVIYREGQRNVAQKRYCNFMKLKGLIVRTPVEVSCRLNFTGFTFCKIKWRVLFLKTIGLFLQKRHVAFPSNSFNILWLRASKKL